MRASFSDVFQSVCSFFSPRRFPSKNHVPAPKVKIPSSPSSKSQEITDLATKYNLDNHHWIKEAQSKGYIGGDRKKVWVTAFDDRVCSICSALEGEGVSMDEMFSNGVLLPPAHDGCRCCVDYVPI